MTSPLLALAAAAVLALAAPAPAHSLLVASAPAADAVLPAAPERVDLRFNNRIEKRLSTVAVVGADGQRRAGALLETSAPDHLGAAVPPLPPGDYRLEWRVLSADGHVVGGSYRFRIAP